MKLQALHGNTFEVFALLCICMLVNFGFKNVSAHCLNVTLNNAFKIILTARQHSLLCRVLY